MNASKVQGKLVCTVWQQVPLNPSSNQTYFRSEATAILRHKFQVLNLMLLKRSLCLSSDENKAKMDLEVAEQQHSGVVRSAIKRYSEYIAYILEQSCFVASHVQ